MAFDWKQFKTMLKSENRHFKWFKKHSTLDALIARVQGRTTFSPDDKRQIKELLAHIPYGKQQKYAQTLDYANQQLGLGIAAFPFAVPSNLTMYFKKFQLYMGDYMGYNQQGKSKKCPMVPNDQNSIGPCSFVHRHDLVWESSNGNQASMAAVRTREYVKFLKSPQAVPFNAIQDPDQEFRAPGPPHDITCPGTTGATSGIDMHSTKLPAIITRYPRQAGTLTAEQTYEYSTDNGNTWETMDGSHYLLEKTVVKIGQDWIFRFKKSNWLPHNTNGFHFEVEYVIGEPPEYMPRTLADVNVMSSFGIDGDINQYARKVVYTGP